MPFGTKAALAFPLLITEQHKTFSFWNKLPNKSQELSKYPVFSLHWFMSQNACFSFPNSGAAHLFQRIND